MRIGKVAAVCLAAVALAGCGKRERPAQVAGGGEGAAERAAPPASGQGGWVARGGGVTVDGAELVAYARRNRREGLAGVPLEQRRELARRLLVRKALAVEAEREGLGKDPLVERAVMEWKFRTYPEPYWAETVWKETSVSDEELRAAIQPQALYLLSAIVLGDDEEGSREAARVHGLLEAGGDFAELAAEHSLGFAAAKGGEMGWSEIPNRMIEEPEAAVIAATPVGGYTAPVLTRLGWTIFKVRDRRDADQVFAERKAAVLPSMLAAKYEAAQARRRAELRAAASISYPADSAPAGSGAPAAVVNGYVFPAQPDVEGQEGHARIPIDITPRKKLLEKTIDALLIVTDAERLGLHEKLPELRAGLAVARMEALAQHYLRAKGDAATVTPEEERAEYERFYSPDVYEIEMIVTGDRGKATEALGRARAGEDFAALAKEYNTGKLAASAGRVPLGSTSQFAPAIREALPRLADGGVSDVLDAGGGAWALVRRLGKQHFDPPPFEQVASQVRKRLELRKRAELTDAFAEQFARKIEVELSDEALAAL